MHRTPKANPALPAHQPPVDDYDLQAMDDNDVQADNDVLVDPEHQNHPRNPEKVAKEKVTYHPLINGKVSVF
jgi:hypothetical protein